VWPKVFVSKIVLTNIRNKSKSSVLRLTCVTCWWGCRTI